MGLSAGTVLNGRYQIIDRLGKGGMGVVWRGHDLLFKRDVAIKVMNDQAPDADDFARFLREAQVGVRLQHPGIAAVYDIGRTGDDIFITMELLTGSDLRTVVAAHPTGIPVSRVLDLMAQAADALAVAHEQGVIHRDLTPGNMVVADDGRLKICDFGLAKVLDASRPITKPDTTFGTPAYMSPEQFTTAAVDTRSDLYSLGCVTYALVTGHPPFKADTWITFAAQHAHADPEPPSGDQPIPPEFSNLVLRMLAKDPADRPESAAAIAAELRKLAEPIAAETPKESDEPEPEANATAVIPPAEFTTPFIPRVGLLKAVTSVLSIRPEDWVWHTGHVCVAGDADTGKTRFLWEITAERQPVWINAESDERMLPEMLAVLASYGQDTEGLTDHAVVKAAFGRLLGRPDGPRLAVIDGIADPALVDQFLPRFASGNVYISSRRRPPKGWAPVIDVDVLDDTEAFVMTSMLLPDASDADAQALRIMTGYRPRLIEQACSYIRNRGVADIQAFCTSVGQDVETALNAIGDSRGQTLTAIYRRYAEELGREAPDSLRLLELLPYIAHLCVPPEFLMAYLLGVPYIRKEDLTRAQLTYEAAIRPLQAYSLVTVSPTRGISIQPFTQHVLRAIFGKTLAAKLQSLQTILQVNREALYAEGWSLLTVTGRQTCGRVLLTHLIDEFQNGSTLASQGIIGGVQWGMLVTHLWHQQLKLELLGLIANGTIQVMDGGALGWEAFLATGKDRAKVQQDELLGVRDIIERILAPEGTNAATSGGPDSDPAGDEETTAAKFKESLADYMARLTPRYQHSPVGELDLRIVHGWAFDSTEAEQIRRAFLGMLDQASMDEE
jgi:predicted Ser/Thr protein kinase